MTLPPVTKKKPKETPFPQTTKDDKILFDELASLETYHFIRLGYTVEKRVYKDVYWFNGWFRNLQPEWSKWMPIYSYQTLPFANKMKVMLENRKSYKKFTVEYRLVKDNHG